MIITVAVDLSDEQINKLHSLCILRTLKDATSIIDSAEASDDDLMHMDVVSANIKATMDAIETLRQAVVNATIK